jgi:hypothetical protein
MTRRCFVIGPIGPPGGEVRATADDFIQYIIGPCCTEELGLGKPIRADLLPEPGRITSQIIELLQNADVVVADLTGGNANVYYELSCRHAIGKPAIHMALAGTVLPFDVYDNRTIPYTMHARDVDRAKADLTAQIKRVLEPGYKPRNPILDAIGLIALERSTEPFGQALATLVGDVQLLRGEVATLRSSVSSPINTLTLDTASGYPLGLGLGAAPGYPLGAGLGYPVVARMPTANVLALLQEEAQRAKERPEPPGEIEDEDNKTS